MLFRDVFATPSFRVNIIDDVAGPELCGALKNIVALAAGFVDGLKCEGARGRAAAAGSRPVAVCVCGWGGVGCATARLGGNTKAAVMRIGLMEMKRFAETFHIDVKPQTFLESCGVGDLITTCYNGRNHRVAMEVVRTGKVGRRRGRGRSPVARRGVTRDRPGAGEALHAVKSFEQLEAELLHGQKLQGTLTASEVYQFVREQQALDRCGARQAAHGGRGR